MAAAAEEYLGPEGSIARSLPSYERRGGQIAMAGAVERVLSDGGQLMVEAATGTGKTLAYLVPALAAGRRVIVSTGTRNLQDQIFEKDLPFLRAHTDLPVSAALMKGRDNYLCRYRMERLAQEPLLEDPSESPWIGRLSEWGETTASGDRAEIPDLPDRLRLWRDVNARADTCTGRRCPEYEPCWLTQMKRRAEQAQIVVVNHHLFFADLAVRSAYGAVLPDYDTVIFDEAHLVEEVATLYFGVQISAAQLEDLARQAERTAARAGGPSRGGGGAAGLRQAAFDLFRVIQPALARATGRIRFDPPDRGGADLEAEWAVLSEALDEVSRQSERNETGADAAESIGRRATEARDSLERVLDRRDGAYVYGAEMRGRANIVLSAAPIEVGPLLRARLFERLEAVVLTSASMTVGGGFDFFRDRLGLPDAECRVVDSAFDWAEQARLYLPQGMPEPAAPDFVDRALSEIVPLLELTDGRAFLLFTSHANLRRAADGLGRLDRWPLIVQGDGSKVALVERFKETPRAVLCGTTSFWHGVDVPGRALSLVVVDKLPFGVPGDPLVAARIDRIREAGGNPFRDYQVPLAVLELKQGLGRLLRSRRDRGILAVLDPRLTGRRYGKIFLDSLPPYRIVRSRQALEGFPDPA